MAKQLNRSDIFVEAVFHTALNIMPVADKDEMLSQQEMEDLLPLLDGMRRVVFAINDRWSTCEGQKPRPDRWRWLLMPIQSFARALGV
ncbi:hypothetical protein [Aureimonas phyllosphaerae]|uniref:Uncharacterized protein n=1 Tax=Aureimonas phyllosphaerae TaxID=1166078 RepID=A0A7W6FW07_9HYPH|nr:hypothetical protein [Aureimonas phyllosphaerae]MBB3937395.1 hypothetical protein [Aureimonas phyllosphaerae]MBB3961539.1 hypothetical protein [Aureimonas phyllosphaerae]